MQFSFAKMMIRLFSRVLLTSRKRFNVSYCRSFTTSLSRFYYPKLNPKSSAPSSGILQNQELIDDHYTFISISAIKQFLLHKDIVFSDGHTCISINCPLCGSLNSLFINKISGSFICSCCKKSGSWNLLELFMTNPKNHVDIQEDEEITFGKSGWKKVVSETEPVNRDSCVNKIVTEFAVPVGLLKDLDVRVSRDNEELYFPLVYNSDKVGFLTLKPGMVEETFPFKCAKGIIIRKRKSTSAIVVATLQDFLALLSTPVGYDIVCLPHGQQTLPQEILPLFEEYSKLILWFNNDSVSWGNMKMFAKKFLEERCSLVQPIESQPSPYECMKCGIDIPDIIKSAQEVAHHSIITFANLREDVLSELYNADKVSGVKWERFPTLNSILKGHRRGELTILTGSTGSGKTTFISEYSLDLICSKVTTLWGSFEIRNQRLARTMMTQLFQAPLDKNLDKYEEWADKFERLPLYFMTFYGQQPLDAVMETVKHATYVHDVVHVIIDNVQFMLGLSNNEAGFLDRFYRQDALIASFRNFATTHNCHVTLVIHPRKEREAEQLTANSIFGGAKAAQEADNILIIQNKISHSTLRTKKYLQIAKNRFSGDLGIMPLEFNKETLSFRSDKRD